ncbi:hypothetical protein [Roseovarius sp. EL26]|uniref:hypothetical protein n=1 Tax=Roseovarius sp. EL26 TaxID=2126672 RepID=UPI0020B150D2|nr:hypothetical protein [Roseovarius sp. EL26]
MLPTGEFHAVSARGTMMGNRGILHDDQKRLGRARWTHQAWVTCVLTFKGRHREVMGPRKYTELFFLDEAVALAAGHRPCGECRRAEYLKFRGCWDTAHGPAQDLKSIDRHMHQDRVSRTRAQIRHSASLNTLPDGTFILYDMQPHLVWGPDLLCYTPERYSNRFKRPSIDEATVMTPRATLAVLHAGYRPALHPTATSDHG